MNKVGALLSVGVVSLALAACGSDASTVQVGSDQIPTQQVSREVSSLGPPWLVPVEPAEQDAPDAEVPAPVPGEVTEATVRWAEEVRAVFGPQYTLGSTSEIIENDGSVIRTVQLRSGVSVVRATSQQLTEPLPILPRDAKDDGSLGSYTIDPGSGETLVAKLDRTSGADSPDVRVYRVAEDGRMVVVNAISLEPTTGAEVSPLSESEVVDRANAVLRIEVGG